MAGRKVKADTEALKTILQENYNLFCNNFKVVPPSSSIWVDLINKYNLKISTKNLYSHALLYNKSKEFCKSVANESDADKILPNSSSTENNSEISSSSSSDTEKITNKQRYFKIFMLKEEWTLIKPEIVYYNVKDKRTGTIRKRKYLRLQKSAWTNTLAKIIWNTTKEPCVWKFTNQYVSNQIESNIYLKVKGICTVCSAVLYCQLNNNPDENEDPNVFMDCSITGLSSSIVHDKKRRFHGLQRLKCGKEMLQSNKFATVVRRNMARQNASLFDQESPIVPKLETLRKSKSEVANKDRIDPDPIQSLYKMAQRDPFQLIIHEIGIFKFYLHYWTPEQVRVYNEYCRKEKYPRICFDATGKVVKKISRIDDTLSGHIFLYSIVIKLSDEHEGQIPIAQMLSERHNSNAIQYWLTEWRRLGAKEPKEVICDFSMALLSAACRAFAGYMDINSYIAACMKVIGNNDHSALPKCFIRVDVAHIIKAVGHWRELHPSNINSRSKIRQFYIRGIGQILLSTHLDEAIHILESLFIIALSQYEGNLITHPDTPTTCETRKRELLSKFAYGVQQSAISNILESDVNISDVNSDVTATECLDLEVALQENNTLSELISTLHKNVQNITNEVGDRDNIMYLPSIIQPLTRLCSKLPLWSGIMIKYFGYGNLTSTSTHVESYFNDLKHRQFLNLPLPVDKFLIKHSQILEDTMYLASGLKYFHNLEENFVNNVEKCFKTNNDKHPVENTCNPDPLHKEIIADQNKNLSSPSDDYIREINSLDNWKGLAIKRKTKKNKLSLYLNPQGEWATIGATEEVKPVKILLLKNGGNINAPVTRHGKQAILSLANTCAFDSIAHALATTYCDSKKVRDTEDEGEALPVFELAAKLCNKPNMKEIYEMRRDILANIFDTTKAADSISRINCDTTINNMIKMLNLVSYKEKTSCSDCKYTTSISFYSIPTDTIILQAGIHMLEKSIIENRSLSQNCVTSNCTGIVTHSREYSNIILIDYFISSNPNSICLNSIPKSIELENSIYHLRAVIEFQPPALKNALGHFVAFCRRSDWSWQIYNDLEKKVLNVSPTSNVNVAVIMYSA